VDAERGTTNLEGCARTQPPYPSVPLPFSISMSWSATEGPGFHHSAACRKSPATESEPVLGRGAANWAAIDTSAASAADGAVRWFGSAAALAAALRGGTRATASPYA